MKQKLALSCTLIHTPDVLILDEPTTGVDPISRQEFWQILRNLARDGMALLVSTPYMDEALLCDRVLLVNQGVAIADGKPEEITARFGGRILEIETDAPNSLRKEVTGYMKGEAQVYRFGSTLHIVYRTNEQRQSLVTFFDRKGMTATESEPEIEDLFVYLTSSDGEGESDG